MHTSTTTSVLSGHTIFYLAILYFAFSLPRSLVFYSLFCFAFSYIFLLVIAPYSTHALILVISWWTSSSFPHTLFSVHLVLFCWLTSTFPFQQGLGHFCYIPFMVVCVSTALYVRFFLPETKGKSLLEITEEFTKHKAKSHEEKNGWIAPTEIKSTMLWWR